MRIYSNAYELMSETGRNLTEMGHIVKPKTYQNKNIQGIDEFQTKEIICEQYCLTAIPDPQWLFIYTKAKECADKEFEERVSGVVINPGKAWKLRKDMWEQFLVQYLDEDPHFDYTYPERINHHVKYRGRIMTKLEAIIELLKNDHDTRKAVLNIFGEQPYNTSNGPGNTCYCDSNSYDGSARIPCSMYYDFLIRDNAKGEKVLHICYHQRSSDFIGHFGDDVYLAWKLMEYVAGMVNIKPGYLYHTIDSLHAYKKDWWMLKTSIDDIK